jgi:hypothetical protein
MLLASVLLVTSCARGAVKTTRDEPGSSTSAAAPRPDDGESPPAPQSSDETLVANTTPTTTSAAAAGAANTAAEDVQASDPLPPQADGVADPDAAEVAIRFAFQHWLLIDLDKDLRSKLVEQGELNIDGLDSGVKAARGIAEFARFAIDGVRITSPESADVDFRVRWHNGVSPNFPNRLTGDAIFQDGSWRVSGKVVCILALGSGQNCSGVQARNPTVPSALRLSVVPEGFASQAINGVMQVAVPGGASWRAGTAWLAITTQTLVGLSALDHDAAATMLASGRYGVGDGTAVDVTGRAGRYSERPDGSQLMFIREDDVLVIVQAVGLPAEQIMQVATALVPDKFDPRAVSLPEGPLPGPGNDTTRVTAVTGRPLWRRRKMLLARTRWGRRVDGLGLDNLSLHDLSRADAHMLREYWRRIARFEHASVPAFEELATRLRRVRAPVHLIDRAMAAADQERDHTARAVSLAERFAGRELRLRALQAQPDRFVSFEHELAQLAVEALRDGVLNEGYAAWQAAAQAKAASDPQVVATLAATARDEAEHADLSRDVLAWCMKTSSAVPTAVIAAMQALPNTFRVPPIYGPIAEWFGAADPDPDRTFFRTLRSMVIDDTTGLLEIVVPQTAAPQNDFERVP